MDKINLIETKCESDIFCLNNSELDNLLQNVDQVHKIILDERKIMIVKLHNDRNFERWLTEKNIMPTIKKYHTPANTLSYLSQERSSGNGTPIFITLAIIPRSDKKNPKIKIACCDLDIARLNNVIFSKKSSSGIIFNGSYFYLAGHIDDHMYGISGTSGQNYWLITKPIGYFKYDTTTFGKDKSTQKNPDYSRTYDGYSLENKKYKDENDVYDKQNPVMTLLAIKDMLGFAVFNNEGGMYILKYSEYNNSTQPKTTNVAMGNLLVYNGNILMSEDKICTGILLFSLGLPSLDIYDKIYLCNSNFDKLTGDEINDLPLNSVVNFISYVDETIRGKIKFNPNNIFLPYCLRFIRDTHPSNFAGKVPPGYPTHASDLNPRTCIMKDSNNNIVVIQVEGRNQVCGGIGIDLFDLAKLCKGLGATYALNLDGGGSSKLLWKEKNNSANYAGLASYEVSNAIFIN